MKRLTIPQLRELYFCERDKNGSVKMRGQEERQLSPRELHWIKGRRRGLTERQIGRTWEAHLASKREIG